MEYCCVCLCLVLAEPLDGFGPVMIMTCVKQKNANANSSELSHINEQKYLSITT